MSCTYYDNGLIKSVTDQNKNTTNYEYNKYGQITKETDGNNQSIDYEYDD